MGELLSIFDYMPHVVYRGMCTTCAVEGVHVAFGQVPPPAVECHACGHLTVSPTGEDLYDE